MNGNSFGGQGRYYSANAFDKPHRDAHAAATEEQVKKALLEVDPEIEQRITRTFRQWNTIIREQLRNEMGLRLTVGGDYQSVPVRIAPGLARPLQDVFQGMSPLYWRLLLNKGALEASRVGLSFLSSHCEEIDPHITIGGVENPCPHVAASLEFVEAVLFSLSEEQGLKRALAIDHDILGGYFYNQSRIELYWMAIGLISGGLGVSPEALTVVVAIHELAHAYSHLGKDIDGSQWEKRNFEKSDLHIVEGIAQYYTQVICKSMEDRLPGALAAFYKLLEFQSSPYTGYREWVLPAKSSGEVVRLTMIACRSKGFVSYPHFLDEMKSYENIKQHKRSQVALK